MTDPLEPTEARLRDALRARADSVEPLEGGATMTTPVAPDRSDIVRRRWMIGLGTAAAFLIGFGTVAALAANDDNGHDKVESQGDAPTTTGGPTTTLVPDSTTSADSTSTTPGTTAVTTPGTATTQTTVGSTTPVSVPETTVPPTAVPPVNLPGATTAAKSGNASGDATGIGTALLTKVRVGNNGGFDRIVFEFQGTGTPGWEVSYEDGPFTHDGSGAPVSVSGHAFIHVRMFRASGYDADAGHPSYTGPDRVPGSAGGNVNEVVANGDFEGVLSWVVGLDGKAPFRVSTLSTPSRLVIDVAHT
jgi:hypothetical protein